MIQYIFGRQINIIFWFQFNLIFITLIFSIISFIFKKRFLYILIILIIIAYILQYSLINYYFCIKYNNLNFRNIGTIVEILPFAVTGVLLSSLNIINLIRIKNNIYYLYLIILYFILKYNNIFFNIPGIIYPGIKLNIGAICIFLSFSCIQFDKVKNKNIIKFIECITNYTGGIYYLHKILINYLRYKLIIIKNGKFLGSIIIYLLNYIICFIGSKLFHNNKIIYLFN